MSSSYADFKLVLPDAPADEVDAVKAWEQDVVLPTWTPAKPDVHPLFLEKRVYQGSSGKVYPLPVIDRIATEPVLHSWRAVHIENEYVRLMVMPELGGRIHIGLDKLNGYDFFYRQDVIKPALVGLAGPWISGGVEFNWPQHHRPATYMPVDVTIERTDDGSVTVWCSDHDPMARMKGMHGVCLHPTKALVELKVRLYNRTVDTQTFLWWANVATRVHEHYQSFFPHDVNCAADHAKRALTEFPLSESVYYGVDYRRRGQEGVPENEQPRMYTPNGSYPANDLSRYANIPVPTSYMIANSAQDYFGGYDHALEAGVVHVANHHVAPGKKQWTWGNQEFGYAWDRCLTESGGPYIELMAGAYTDNQPDFSFLAPGETKSFTQIWYPIRKLGTIDFANEYAALALIAKNGHTALRMQATCVLSDVRIEVRSSAVLVASWQGDVTPQTLFEFALPAEHSKLEVLMFEAATCRLRWAPDEITIQPKPEAATAPPAPACMESMDELYLTGVHLEQYRHPTRSPEPYWQEALRRDAGDSRSNTAMGRWHMRRGQFALAEDYLRRAIERLTRRNPNPADGEAHYLLGLVLSWQNRDDAAYAAWYKATWNAAWRGAAYQRLAEMDTKRGAWAQALDHVKRSLRADADNLNAHALRAIVLQTMGDQQQSADVLQEAMRLDPLDAMVRYVAQNAIPADGQQRIDLVFDLLRWGQYERALQLATAPVAEQPNGAGTLLKYLQGYVLMRMGRSAEAIDTYRVAGQMDPSYVFPSRLEEMLMLEEVIAANPDDSHAPFYLGNLLYDRQRHDEAIALWEKAAACGSTNATVYRNLGFGYFNVRKDAARAENAFQKARAISPNDARLLYEHDQLAKRMGRSLTERLQNLEANLALVAQRDDLTIELATLRNNVSRADEALRLLLERNFQPWEGGEGLALAQFVRAKLRLCVAALTEGRASDAVAECQAALHPPENLGETWHPLANKSQVEYWLGEAWSAAGFADRATACWQRAADQNGDFQQMKVQSVSEMSFWSALAMRRLGEEQSAAEVFNQIRNYAEQLAKQEPAIDYFATSLPAMLLFEADLFAQRDAQSLFLQCQASFGNGQFTEGERRLEQVLALENCHTAALDWKAFWQAGDFLTMKADSTEEVQR